VVGLIVLAIGGVSGLLWRNRQAVQQGFLSARLGSATGRHRQAERDLPGRSPTDAASAARPVRR
jgi:hypothetical protein